MQTVECDVFDLTSNAGAPPRIHELPLGNGKYRTFTFVDRYQPVRMPYETAKALIGNDGFDVQDMNGNILKPLPKHRQSGVRELLITECVANFEELTHESLVARAALAGKKFTKTSAKKTIVDFLVAKNIGAVNAETDSEFEPIAEESGDLLEEEDAY
jgi:hypothetical protein